MGKLAIFPFNAFQLITSYITFPAVWQEESEKFFPMAWEETRETEPYTGVVDNRKE